MVYIHDAEILSRHGWMSTDKVGLMRQYFLSEEDAEEAYRQYQACGPFGTIIEEVA